MIQNALLFATQFANHQDAILVAKNQEMQFVMLNVKNQIVKLNALIKLAKQKIAQNVLLFANLLIVLHIVKHQNQNVKQSAKNQDAIGSAISQSAQNQNVN